MPFLHTLYPHPQVPGGSWLPAALPRPDSLGSTQLPSAPLATSLWAKGRGDNPKYIEAPSLLPFHQDPLDGQMLLLLQRFPPGCLAVMVAAFFPTTLRGAALISLSAAGAWGRVQAHTRPV